MMTRFQTSILPTLLVLAACQDDSSTDGSTVPEFFSSEESMTLDVTPNFVTVADSSDNIDKPNDLAFHPHQDRAMELWIINEGVPHTGGTTVTLFDTGTIDQTSTHIKDGNAWHFLSMPTALSFSDNGNWASGLGVQDANHSGGTFAGPTLWSSDFAIYGAIGDPPTADVNGSHLDMLHGSPYSMGIAYERVADNPHDNAFWVFDGYHGYPVRYDFQAPHYPGGHDHSDGLVHRYTEVELTKHDHLPSHMIVDQQTGWLYINDTGANRVLRLDVNSGQFAETLPLINEPLTEHWRMDGVIWEVFFEDDLVDPTGIALNDGRLFIGNHGTDEIVAIDIETGVELARIDVDAGVRGLTIGPDGLLWMANYDQNRIVQVVPR
jgi:hypothetical protein